MPNSSIEDYEVLDTIGTGSYGTCKKIRRKRDGKILVWKELDYGTMSESEKQMLVSEVNLLRELKHEHIVRYHDRIIDRAKTRLYIIMEYCEGGDLASYVTKLKKENQRAEEEFVWKVCIQVAKALKECHCRQRNGKVVLHRDLKPANVFLDTENNVKLGDFGLARVLNHETSFARTFVGTPYYMSPEQMNYMSYNEKSDVWSLGCMLYELCSLRPPFTAVNQKELASKINVGRFARLPAMYAEDLNQLIAFMLQVDENKRPSIDQLLEYPLLAKRITPESQSKSCQGRLSAFSDEGYNSRCDSLRKKEEALQKLEEELRASEMALKAHEEALRLRELALKQKEEELQNKQIEMARREKENEVKEKNLTLREKIVEERHLRLERMLKDNNTPKTPSNTSSHSETSEQDGLNGSCHSTSSRSGVPSSSRETVPVTKVYGEEPVLHKKVSFVAKEKENLYSGDLHYNPGHLHKQYELDHARNMVDLRARLRKAQFRSDLRRSGADSRYRTNQLLSMR